MKRKCPRQLSICLIKRQQIESYRGNFLFIVTEVWNVSKTQTLGVRKQVQENKGECKPLLKQRFDWGPVVTTCFKMQIIRPLDTGPIINNGKENCKYWINKHPLILYRFENPKQIKYWNRFWIYWLYQGCST